MITKSMAEMLANALNEGTIKSGKTYEIMPSDCRGDGYDIAMKSRPDESGVYEIDGHTIIVTCSVKCGSRQWRNGIPVAYKAEVDPEPGYTLEPGEKAMVIHRIGRKIGNSGYMSRKYASIAIIKADGRKKYRGHTPYWLDSTSTYASHYISGLSKADDAAYWAEVERLEIKAALINATAENICFQKAA